MPFSLKKKLPTDRRLLAEQGSTQTGLYKVHIATMAPNRAGLLVLLEGVLFCSFLLSEKSETGHLQNAAATFKASLLSASSPRKERKNIIARAKANPTKMMRSA